MSNESLTASQIVDDIKYTRRDADIVSKISNFGCGYMSSVQQYIKTRMLVLMNRFDVLTTQKNSRGNSPKNYETDSRNITKEIRQLKRIAPFLDINEYK